MVEDGTDLATCKKVEVNVRSYLEKYNFHTAGRKITDPQEKYFLSLSQEDFERRAFLEMLHFASKVLKARSVHQVGGPPVDENEINKHRNEFTHLFQLDGTEITSLRDILAGDSKILVCALSQNFKGMFDTSKMSDFHGSKVMKNNNVKNCLMSKIYKWARDKMLDWTEENEKIEGSNKILDLTNHIEGVVYHQRDGCTPYEGKRKLEASPYRAATSPLGGLAGVLFPEEAFDNINLSRARSVLKSRTKVGETIFTSIRSQSVHKKQQQHPSFVPNPYNTSSLKDIREKVAYDRKQQAQVIVNHDMSQDYFEVMMKKHQKQGTGDSATAPSKRTGKPPVIKFIGNARKKMLYMSPDRISELKKEQAVHPEKY
jgi:hypothetical protein